MSGGTDLSLFLILVLAPGDGKDEGKEPETDSEFVDIKGICYLFPQLHSLKYLLRVLGREMWTHCKSFWGS